MSNINIILVSKTYETRLGSLRTPDWQHFISFVGHCYHTRLKETSDDCPQKRHKMVHFTAAAPTSQPVWLQTTIKEPLLTSDSMP